jgi:hypothetical protein
MKSAIPLTKQKQTAFIIAVAAAICSLWNRNARPDMTNILNMLDFLILVGTIVITISALAMLFRAEKPEHS